MHYHNCPSCYNAFACTDECTIEYDLQDGDKEFGAYCLCLNCDPDIPFSEEWWNRYCGFKKKE